MNWTLRGLLLLITVSGVFSGGISLTGWSWEKDGAQTTTAPTPDPDLGGSLIDPVG